MDRPDPDAYHAALNAAALRDRSGRGRLVISGPDRAKFLHNLTTADVKATAIGAGREAFVTTPQGKTLGHVTLLAGDGSILVRAERDGLDVLRGHLAKYGVFDDVEIADVSAETFEYHVCGPEAEAGLAAIGLTPPGARELDHVEATLGGHPVRVVRESPAGLPGLTVIGAMGEAEATLDLGGFPRLDDPTFEALRIEAGTPRFGRDVTAENLPQEVGRDARAISFVKGCYLGQETVARLDALGHVNKILVGGEVDSEEAPPAGTPLVAAGKVVGAVTSSSPSPRNGGAVVLGYVKVAHAAPGSTIGVGGEGGPILTVVALPMR